MPSPELLIILLFLGVAVASLLSGFPVAFGLGGAGLLLLAVLVGLSALGLGPTNAQGGALVDASIWRDLTPLSNDVYGFMLPSGRMLLAIPLFILMGFLLQHAGVAQALLRGLSAGLRGVPGGLGVAVVLVGGVLAASTGVVGASVATLTVIALPSLLSAGYGERRAGGIVAASGTLGQIIPPSIILLLLADQVGTQFAAARLAAGDFAPMAITSGDLFRGAMLPGVLTLLGFMGLALWQGRGISPTRFRGHWRGSCRWRLRPCRHRCGRAAAHRPDRPCARCHPHRACRHHQRGILRRCRRSGPRSRPAMADRAGCPAGPVAGALEPDPAPGRTGQLRDPCDGRLSDVAGGLSRRTGADAAAGHSPRGGFRQPAPDRDDLRHSDRCSAVQPLLPQHRRRPVARRPAGGMDGRGHPLCWRWLADRTWTRRRHGWRCWGYWC